MIHGTTINLYSVGHCRLALCFAFALAFSCFGQYAWQVSDVDFVRSQLEYIEYNTRVSKDEILSIGSDVAGCEIFLDDISHDTGDILSRLNNLVFTRKHELLVSDTGLVHVASSIDKKIDRLEHAINNLTNYMCYSSEYVCAFNSNMLHLATSIFGNAWPYSTLETIPSSINTQMLEVARYIESGDYAGLNRYFGLWRAFPMMLYSILDYNHIPRDKFNQSRSAFLNLFGIGSLPFFTNSLQQVSAPVYYQYGTRELTDTAIGFSNLLSTANQTGITDLDGSISSHTVYDSTGQASHSTTSLFGRVSGQLGKTFGIYGEPAETNDVKQIDSPQLRSQQSTIIADNVQYSINDGCQQVNSTVSGVVDSIFEGRNTSGAFVIPGFSINGYNAGLDDVVIDPADYNLSHAGLRWFFNAVRALCLVGFVISSLWRIISVESKLNAPDPF